LVSNFGSAILFLTMDRFLPCLLLLTVLLLSPAHAQKAVALDPNARINEFIESCGLRPDTPGMALLITRGGDVLHERYLGIADLRKAQAIDSNTPFRLGSCTKPFTALAIAQLAQNGRIPYNTPVQQFLPSLPWKDLTIEHLLTHQGGVPEHTGFHLIRSPETNADVVKLMKGKRLKFQPGTQYLYSNTGYVLLAQTVEAASGLSYPDYLKRYVFHPAGMSHALVPGANWEKLPGRAVGYRREFGFYQKDDQDSMNGIVGHGGIYASARELDRFLTAYHGNQLCSSATKRMMLQPHSQSGEGYRYGYGWTLSPLAQDRLIWHNGNWLGFDSFMGRLEKQGLNIVILSNAGLSKRQVDVAKELALPIAEWYSSR